MLNRYLSLHSLPPAVVDKILDPLSFADIFRLGSACKTFQALAQEHVRSRRRISPDDLPSRNIRCSSIFKTLGRVKQPHSLSLHLRLLPDFDFQTSNHSYGFTTSHLGTFRFLTNVTLLLDEPRTNYSDGGVEDAVSRGMLAPCIEAVCLSAAPVHTVMAGGLRYPNAAKLTRAFSLMATYKTCIRRLHLTRLDHITGDDLLQLTPAATYSRRSSRKIISTIVEGSVFCLHTTSQERLSDGSHADGAKASASGTCEDLIGAPEGLLGRLEAFSVVECPKVSDSGLAAVLKHAVFLKQIVLVPDDDGVLPGHGGPRTVLHGGAAVQQNQIGPLCLQVLSQSASRLKYLYLSEELSPSSFGEGCLKPLVSACTKLERLHLNIPVSDDIVRRIAACCQNLTAVTLLCANITDSSLTVLFERCNKITHVALCGSPYFGSRGITGAFLTPLLKRPDQICQLTLDSMHHTTAEVIVRLLALQLPPGSTAVLGPTAVDVTDAAQLIPTAGIEGSHVSWRSSSLPRLQYESGPLYDVDSSMSSGSSLGGLKLLANRPAAAAGSAQLDDMCSHCEPETGSHSPQLSSSCREKLYSEVCQQQCRQSVPPALRDVTRGHSALLSSLTMLHLDNLPMLSKGGVGQITALLAQAPHLRCLSLLGYDGPVDTVLTTAVQQCQRLESVAVGGCHLLTDVGLCSLCQLPPQLRSLSIQNCIMVSSRAILDVLTWHNLSMECVDLWGTRACGQQLASLLASGRYKRVNVGGSLTSGSSRHEGLLRNVFNDLPVSCGTDLSTTSPSLLLSQRVMFGPRFHQLLAKTGLPVE